jgi:hypothetical protein
MKKSLATLNSIALNLVQGAKMNNKLMQIVLLAQIYKQIEDKTIEVDEKLPELSLDRFLDSSDFEIARTELLDIIKIICDKVYAFAYATKRTKLATMVKTGRGSLSRITNQGLAMFADKLIEEIKPILAELEPFFLTADDITNLTDTNEGYKLMIEEKEEHKRRYTLSSTLVNETTKFYEKAFSDLLILLQGVKREFPNEYQVAQNLISSTKVPRNNKWSLNGKITDEDDAPLICSKTEFFVDEDNSVLQSFTEKGLKPTDLKVKPVLIKQASKNGMYICRVMEPGSYTAYVSMNGYEPQVVKVYINPKNKFELVAKLKPLAIQ